LKIYGNIKNVEVLDPVISNLQGIERRCAECHKFFEEGDEIVVFLETTFKEKEVSLSNLDFIFVHVKGKETGSCLEDFIGRFIANRGISSSKPIDNSVNETVK